MGGLEMDSFLWALEKEPFHIPLSPEQERQFGTASEQRQELGRRIEKACGRELWEAYQDRLDGLDEWNHHVAFQDGFHLAAEFFLEILCRRQGL